jgi:hypothetical protein
MKQAAWLRSVPAAILDAESTVQDKAMEAVCDVILAPAAKQASRLVPLPLRFIIIETYGCVVAARYGSCWIRSTAPVPSTFSGRARWPPKPVRSRLV